MIGAPGYAVGTLICHQLQLVPSGYRRLAESRWLSDTKADAETAVAVKLHDADCAPWAFVIGRLRHDRHGKTDMRNG